VLVFLCVMIIGLIVGIVVVNADKSSDNGGSIAPDCKTKQTYYDIGVCVEEVYAASGDEKQVISLYEGLIQTAKDGGDYDSAADLIRQRTTFLANNGYCEKALQLLDVEDVDGYSVSALNGVYMRAISLGQQCGDEGAVSKWNGLLFEINKNKDPNDTSAIQNY